MGSKSPFTNQIRRLRFDHEEMTQEQLATRVGVTRQTIISLEANRYVPSLLLAVRIARTFGVTVEKVFMLPDEGDGAAYSSNRRHST